MSGKFSEEVLELARKALPKTQYGHPSPVYECLRERGEVKRVLEGWWDGLPTYRYEAKE